MHFHCQWVPKEVASGWVPLLVVQICQKSNCSSPTWGCYFSFPFARHFLPCSSGSRGEPTAPGPRYYVSIYCVPVLFIMLIVLAELPSPFASQLQCLLLVHKASTARCFQRKSSISKDALNLLIQLGFSDTSYLTEWRKTSNSSKTTSSPRCNILIFSWLPQASLKFSRI